MFSGCNSYTFYHGYPSSSVILWKNIKVGDSSDTIIRILGNPILKEGNTWFYVSYKIYTNNTFAKRQYSSDLLKLTFDNNKVLKLEEIKISKRKLYEIYKKSSLVGGINDSFLRRMQLKLHN
ncbi:outer membrane protein assembly factor BamE domain-containing protein [Candidatus Neoehrlichia procyonis]|nr:outer membrane protein assembly factor BamE [Candidatus Neoehrlichia lotoris]